MSWSFLRPFISSRSPLLTVAAASVFATASARAGAQSVPTTGTAAASAPFHVYAGASYIPLAIDGLRDFHISDFEQFGTGPAEGRVLVPLGREKNPGKIGGTIGLSMDPIFLELSYLPFSKSSYLQVNAGIEIPAVNKERFAIGLRPSVGYANVTANFGQIEVLPGKTPPVILPEGTFDVGDELKTSVSGFVGQGNAYMRVGITRRVQLLASGGYAYSFFGNTTVKAGDVDIPLGSTAIVEPVLGSRAKAAIDPKISVRGVTGTAGLRITF